MLLSKNSTCPWQLPASLEARRAKEGGVAYVCTGGVCSEPITALPALEAVLQATDARLLC
jgi:hypothetical protein